jgi:hypothetical protein
VPTMKIRWRRKKVGLGLLGVLTVYGCGASQMAPGHNHQQDKYAHCVLGHSHGPDSRDGTFADAPVEVMVGNSKDTQVPMAISDWMFARGWHQEHDDWHNIRRWDQNCRKSNAPEAGCAYAERLTAKGLWRAPIQEGAPGDGYDFLAMHRHMIQMVREAFPSAKALLSGFKRVPRSKEDAENPQPWTNVRWSTGQLEAINKLENIESHLAEFPTEDELALYMEAPFRWTPERPSEPRGDASGIHFALHAQWTIAGSPVALANGAVTIDNATFWKLHGWLDDVWERYRTARGIGSDDAKYVKALEDQCREMVDLDELNLTPKPAKMEMPVPEETGYFVQEIRPIFDVKCAGCHNAVSQQSGLPLGGAKLSSAEIVKKMLNVESTNGEYKLVEPGQPEKSWLFIKASTLADTVECKGACNRAPMPPAGDRLNQVELEKLKQWIQSGAPVPVPK